MTQNPQYPPPDPYGRGRRPIDYQTPPPGPSAGRQVLRVLMWIVIALVVGFLVLLGTCAVMMSK